MSDEPNSHFYIRPSTIIRLFPVAEY